METLLITGSEVTELLAIEECITAVEHAFKLRALGKAEAPGILGIHTGEGGFHIKAGNLHLDRNYFVCKLNANFPHNMKRNGLPTIQGVVVVCDADNGKMLALLDSIEITIIRTGAATAVAAKYLSKENSSVVTICGCGNQGRISLKALTAVRKIEKVFAYDIDEDATRDFVHEFGKDSNMTIDVVHDLPSALRASDIIITCTTSKKYFVNKEHIRPGTFIGAVGADSEDKQEIDPRLLSAAKVVVDSKDQASRIGELHHAIKDGLMSIDDVHAELGEIIAGRRPARSTNTDVMVFDSTGTALQDVAAAAIVYERAIALGTGLKLGFAR